MLPSIFGENLFDDWFDFPTLRELRNIDRKLYGRNASHEMKTDVKEHEDHYDVDIDLPGGKTLTVSKSAKAKPAKGTTARVAGRKVTNYRISHDNLVSAGTIDWK